MKKKCAVCGHDIIEVCCFNAFAVAAAVFAVGVFAGICVGVYA